MLGGLSLHQHKSCSKDNLFAGQNINQSKCQCSRYSKNQENKRIEHSSKMRGENARIANLKNSARENFKEDFTLKRSHTPPMFLLLCISLARPSTHVLFIWDNSEELLEISE